MKLIIRAIVTTCIAGVIFLTIMAVSGRMNRSMELKSNLPSAAEETAEGTTDLKIGVSIMELTAYTWYQGVIDGCNQ